MKNLKHIFAVLICALGICQLAFAETSYFVEAQGAYSRGTYTPLWLMSNKYGLSSPQLRNGYVRGNVTKHLNDTTLWDWGGGVDLVVPYHYSSNFIIQQLYAEVRYRKFSLYIGSKEEKGMFNNPRLSSGSMLFSGNARPIPQAKLALDDYVMIPGTKNWLGVLGYISFGRFTDDKWQKSFVDKNARRSEDVLFHSKGIYFQLTPPMLPQLKVEGGLEMAAQYGGKIYNYMKADSVLKMPTTLKDHINAILCNSGGKTTPMGEQTNVYGNHVGSWNFCATWDFNKSRSTRDFFIDQAKAYYEHFFEDHSMMFFEYIWHDGLYGLELTFKDNPYVKGIVYEYIYSKDQSGPVYNDTSDKIPEQVSGRDSYYNHSIYSGWQHWGMGIGNPLFMSPIYFPGAIRFPHNRLICHHLGLEGQPFSQLKWRALLSQVRSWGTYGRPTSQVMRSHSALLELEYMPKQLPGWSAQLAIAIDHGGIIGNNKGVMLTIKKSGLIR